MMSVLAAHWHVFAMAAPAIALALASVFKKKRPGKEVAWMVITARAKREDLPAIARALAGRDEPDDFVR